MVSIDKTSKGASKMTKRPRNPFEEIQSLETLFLVGVN